MEEKKIFQSISNKTPLNFGQKVLAAVLVFSAITVFFFGIWHVKRSIQAPFERVANSETETSTSNNQEDGSIVEMQNKDTDEDGLSDYEELYIYTTSPYLADSDSDNINDKKEVDMGSNPNCPEGQNCGAVSPQDQQEIPQDLADDNPSTTSNNEADLFDFSNLSDISDLNDISSSDLGLEGSAEELLGSLSVLEIRELLKESGLPSGVLDQLTDEQILEAYKTTLENMEKVESP